MALAQRGMIFRRVLSETTSGMGSVRVARTGPHSFGQAFAQNLVGSPTPILIDGTLVQSDVKHTYPNGSIKFLILSHNPASTGIKALTIGSGSAGSPIVPSAWPANTKVDFAIGGTTYTATLPVTPVLTDVWLAGAVVHEARVRVTPKTSANVDHPFLRVTFDVRTYAAAGSYRVDLAIENIENIPAAATVQYTATITVNGAIVYGPTMMVHFVMTRWRAKYLIGTTEGETVPDFRLMHNARALPKYQTLADYAAGPSGIRYNPLGPGGTEAMVSAGWRDSLGPITGWAASYLGSNGGANARALLLANSDLAGSWPFHLREGTSFTGVGTLKHPSITERPNFSINQTPGTPDGTAFSGWDYPWANDTFTTTLANAVTSSSIVLNLTTNPPLGDGSESAFLVDNEILYGTKSGTAITGALRGRFGTTAAAHASGATVRVMQTLAPDYQIGLQHQGEPALVSYLISGDRYYADECGYWAAWNCYALLPTQRNGTPYLAADSTRGVMLPTGYIHRDTAWGIRTIINAAAWHPESAVRTYFQGKVNNNLQFLDAFMDAPNGPFGQSSEIDGLTLTGGVFLDTGLGATWSGHYVTWAVAHAHDQGLTTYGTTYLNAAVAFWVNALRQSSTTPGATFAPRQIFGGKYYIIVATGPTGGQGPWTYLTTWNALFRNSNVIGPGGWDTLYPPTTLNGAITAGQTSITLTNASSWPAPPESRGGVQWDNAWVLLDGREICRYTARTGNVLTVERGMCETTAQSHASGVTAELMGGPVVPGSTIGGLFNPTGGYGNSHRLMLILGIERGVTGAQAAYDWLSPLVTDQTTFDIQWAFQNPRW